MNLPNAPQQLLLVRPLEVLLESSHCTSSTSSFPLTHCMGDRMNLHA